MDSDVDVDEAAGKAPVSAHWSQREYKQSRQETTCWPEIKREKTLLWLILHLCILWFSKIKRILMRVYWQVMSELWSFFVCVSVHFNFKGWLGVFFQRTLNKPDMLTLLVCCGPPFQWIQNQFINADRTKGTLATNNELFPLTSINILVRSEHSDRN